MADVTHLPGRWHGNRLLVPTGGGDGITWVTNDLYGITAEITRRWPELTVGACGCNRCLDVAPPHYPYVVAQRRPDDTLDVIFGFIEADRRVIDMIHAADTRSPHARELRDAFLAHNRILMEQRQRAGDDARHERWEMVEAALRSRRHDYSTPIGSCDPHVPASAVGV